MAQLQGVQALLFDVFGTCVDWRSTVTNVLIAASRKAIATDTLSSSVKNRAESMTQTDWATLAQDWRSTYYAFTRSVAKNGGKQYKTVDQHHRDSLHELLAERKLLEPGTGPHSAGAGSLWQDKDLNELSLVWHRLDPWADTCAGIRALNKKFQTVTLTNGNMALITEMAEYARMDFTHLFSAEMFNSYKPNPVVYLGAAERLNLQPSQCAMVAAHLNDLEAAQQCGYRTIYVERPQEESFPELREKPDLVDMWVHEDQDGFVEVARRLGIADV